MLPEERAEKSAALCRNLLSMPEFTAAHVIFSYMPLSDEADICAVNQALRSAGKHVCFPVTHGKGLMSAYEPESLNDFEAKRYGVREPVEERSRLISPDEIDVVIVPCLAFDCDMKRLGHGAGYYDRFLPKCVNAVKIAAAFEIQRLDDIVIDAYDVPMDAAATEKTIYRRR